MSRFYGEIQGNRGEATRMGTAGSGFRSHIRGWNNGASVSMGAIDDKDICHIKLTNGSNGYSSNHLATTTYDPESGETTLELAEWIIKKIVESKNPYDKIIINP